MTNYIEEQFIAQAKNAGTAMGKIGWAKMQLKVQIELHQKYTKKPDTHLMESISRCIQTLDEAYETLRK